MSVLELKKSIFVRLLENEDFQTLMKIDVLLGKKEEHDADFFEMTEEEERSLDISIAQSENPEKLIPHEQISAKYKSWGKEK